MEPLKTLGQMEAEDPDVFKVPAQTGSIITDTKNLTAGRWYAIGIKNLSEKIEWGCAPLGKYLGDGCWSDDEGEPLETTWDVTLQVQISINDADAYMLQA